MGYLSPEFPNWDNEPSQPAGGGMLERKSKRVTDLHIVFKQGGVSLENPPKEVEKVTENAGHNEFDIDLREPIDSAPYVAPSKLQPNGTLSPPPTSPKNPPGVTLKFKRTGEAPAIDRWWWTFKGTRCSPEFHGDPSVSAQGG